MGKTNKSDGGGGEKKKSTSRSAKAGLTMPVSRLRRHMKENAAIKRIGEGAPVFAAAVLEYISAEVIQTAGDYVKEKNRKRITPADLSYAVRSDTELHKLMGGFHFFTGDKMDDITFAVTLKADREEAKRKQEEAKEAKLREKAAAAAAAE